MRSPIYLLCPIWILETASGLAIRSWNVSMLLGWEGPTNIHGISLILDKQTLLTLSHTSRPYPLPPPSLFIQIYCSSSSLCNKTCRRRRREDKMQTTSGLEKLFCVGRTYKKLLGLHRQTHQPWISDVVLQKHQQSPYWEKNCLSLNKPTGLAINSLLNKVQDVFEFSEQEVRSVIDDFDTFFGIDSNQNNVRVRTCT